MPKQPKQKVIPIKPDPETCGSCKFLGDYEPGADAGLCSGHGRQWIERDGEGEWAFKEQFLADRACHVFKQKLNS